MKSALPRGDHAPFREMLRSALTREDLYEKLCHLDVGWVRARKLLKFPSLLALDLITVSAFSAFRQLLGTDNTEKLEHDGCNAEAILIALYGRDFITGDKYTRRLYEDVKAVAARLWP